MSFPCPSAFEKIPPLGKAANPLLCSNLTSISVKDPSCDDLEALWETRHGTIRHACFSCQVKCMDRPPESEAERQVVNPERSKCPDMHGVMKLKDRSSFA